MNPIINPNQPDHIKYSFNDENLYIISKEIGSEAILEFTDFTINSDNSILPFKDIKTEKGFVVQSKAFLLPYALDHKPGNYIGILNLQKSTRSVSYEREVLKLSTVISYIGGMIGAIAALLFAVKFYTDSSLQMAISI